MMVWSFSIFLLLTFLTAWDANAQSLFDNDVETTSGPLLGTDILFNGMMLKQYLGVPFAKPPLGDLRFQKPQPVQRRTDTLMANKMPPACIQYTEYPFPWYDFEDGQSEDCLYLNIWVPQSLSGNIGLKKYETIFWIHGGGFTLGSNRKDVYEGQALAAEGDVIVVTINYRLAAFGFLTSDTEDAPGNVGMYDMVEALKWVNQNIAAFGGDPDKITLTGQGSGSVAIGLLCVSPLTKDMFQSVIMESASPAYPFADNNTANIAKSQQLAKALGCATDENTIYSDPQEVVQCLKGKEAFEIAKTLNLLHPKTPLSFFPSYENEILPMNARKALYSGNFHDVSVLIGNNHDECAYQITTPNPEVFGFFGEKNPQINKSYGESMLRDIFKSFENPDAVVQHYLGGLAENDYDKVREQVYTASGDYNILCPAVYFAESYSKRGNNVYYYFFVHRPSTTPWASWMGVVHYEEVRFVFGVPLRKPQLYTSQEIALSKRMIKIWSDFVKRGSPTRPNNWPKYSREQPRYVKLDTERRTTYGQGPHKNNCDFFRGYFGFD